MCRDGSETESSIIDEVHETYRRSVEMCFGFYEAYHLCQKGAFT